ncbi:putative bifunctional diguanylate cyclase/phosphodiesterase [Rhodoferax sp.]|uniref:putative bifunctional diguanylate cyclase/phosphodiesterase n=1 Tax=Rhodoferax sp. TaxID=50421 RepID=UPI00274ADCCA|nr:EAL domain-containing protein [Rhodoferax sp.]
MSNNRDARILKPDRPGAPSASDQNPDRLISKLELESMGRREQSVTDHEAAILSREKLVTEREDTATTRESASDSREDAVLVRETSTHAREGESTMREEAATTREVDIRTAEEALQASSTDRMVMLQQANAHLVIASIEAHKLTEQVQSAKARLDHLAHHDVLTDLPNRMLLQDRLGQAIEAARRQGRQLAVMFLDLDRFKHINDALGHAVGDQLLQSVAQRLVHAVRHSDTVSRQGGDEFLLLLPVIEQAQDAALSAQKLLAALALAHHVDGHDLHIGVSIGISIYPDDGHDAQTLIKRADTAMYHAKENGRNTYKFFEPDMTARAVQRQAFEVGLRRALERQEFVLHYQPKVNLLSGRIVGVEALIRWQHPELGLLLPSHFVAIAEDCGLILPMGRWVLREACQQARAWLHAGLPPITVAINTSALEFSDKGFLDNVRATLEQTNMEPSYLELELTESVLMRDAESSGNLLQAIADLGVRLSIDDFGTGYSSLSYLSRFPINALKIDQSFVQQVSTNADYATIVSAVITMGQSLRQRIIAEGVETPEQLAFLRDRNCDEAQGYYFGRPVTAATLASLLETGVPSPAPALTA